MNNNEQSEDVRKILKTEEVKLHKAPKWFLDALARYAKKTGVESNRRHRFMLVDEIVSRNLPGNWLDHWGKMKWLDDEAFVSEPYGFDASDAMKLDHLCSEIVPGTEWILSPNSWWYPGRTIRIIVCKKRCLSAT